MKAGLGTAAAALVLLVYFGWWFPGNLRETDREIRARDFVVFYLAGRAVTKGAPLYQQLETSRQPLVWATEPFGYFYPPAFGLALAPLSRLPYRSAFFLWRCLGEIALLGGVACLVLLTRGRLQGRALLGWYAVALSLPVASKSLWLGQVDALLFCVLAAALLAAFRRRDILCGLLIGIAALCKLHPLLLLVYFGLRGRWRCVGAGLACFLAGNLLAVAWLGWDLHVVYLTRVLPLVSKPTVVPDNVSLYATLAQIGMRAGWLSPGSEAPGWLQAIALLSAIAAGFLVARAWRGARRHPPRQMALAFGAGLAGVLVASKLCWSLYLVLLLIPGCCLWEWADPPPPALLDSRRRALLLFYWALFVGGIFITNHRGVPWSNALALGAAWGVFVLAAVAADGAATAAGTAPRPGPPEEGGC